ncbi:MAG: T9SS type A sorting domain-containing protein [Flavobacteriaceae bacterium]
MKALYTFLISWFCIGLMFSQTDIASVEYFFDTDPGFGNGTTIDINPDAALVDQNFNISTSGLTVGTHRLFLRAVNVDGTSSSMYEHKTFRVAPVSSANTSTLVEAEYFFDVDPGFGNGTLIDIIDIDNLDDVLTVSTSGLSIGTHRLFIRVKNAVGAWSLYEHKTFRVAPASSANTSTLVEAEYFFDTDPGFGSGTIIDIVDIDNLDDVLTVSTSGLSIGTHRLFIRVKNAVGIWTLYEHKTFRVAPASSANTSTLVEAEYFFDTDPGFGSGTIIDIVDIDNFDDVLTVSTSGLPIGTHRFFVRVKNAVGAWSLYEHKTFRVAPTKIINTATITTAEYFIDIDPGVGLATPIVVLGDILDENLTLSTSVGLANGTHFLFIRTKNTDGIWSIYERQEFTSDGALGVDNVALAAINIYPNPTSDFIKIDLPIDNKIDKAIIYDMTGKEVLQVNNSFHNVDIKNLQSGTYLLIIKTEKGSVSRKIIKN